MLDPSCDPEMVENRPYALATEPPFIRAHGPIAERVRGLDWASTPLGPINAWSGTLVSYVHLTL